MDMEEIQYLLGSAIFARAKKYVKRIESYECKTEENGVRHLSAEVKGSGDNLYETEAWLRQNGSFVSASCTCPYNDNGNGLFCKHIGALLLYDQKETAQTQKSCPSKSGLTAIPGVVRGTANLPEEPEPAPAPAPGQPLDEEKIDTVEFAFAPKTKPILPDDDMPSVAGLYGGDMPEKPAKKSGSRSRGASARSTGKNARKTKSPAKAELDAFDDIDYDV